MRAVFGEIALLDGRTRTADAVAATDCQLMVIDRRVPCCAASRNSPSRSSMCCASGCGAPANRSRTSCFSICPDGWPSAAAAHRRRASRKDRKLTMTQGEIGEIIGMSRESTNKQLRDWQDVRIKLERGGISRCSRLPFRRLPSAAANPPSAAGWRRCPLSLCGGYAGTTGSCLDFYAL